MPSNTVSRARRTLVLLVVLLLTFAGGAPWPAGAALLPHDADEPAQEPPISRGEWLILGGILLLVFVWMGVRAVVLARNCTAWERQWRLVEPQWSGRGTAAP